MQVMWETSNMQNDDFLWAGTAFNGGIAGQQQAPCGAISAGTVFMGLNYRCATDDKQKAKEARQSIRQGAADLIASFNDMFGAICCRDLIKLDLSKPEESRLLAGISKEKCDKFVEFVIGKIYEFDEKKKG
ncbi:MAG: C-GCAxxG-C-C family protein [Dehalococcoidales bacterium]|nr:C-GCAxxG-C-C family protein [Dehalococcoidales bacterium]